jgi:putative ABC transport system substrate-binding protein
MKRREFITLLGGTAAWPWAARAQQAPKPMVGFLSSMSSPVTTKRVETFSRGMSEVGFVVGRDLTIEIRMADGQYDRLPALVADLISRRASLIATLAAPATFAAKAATTTMPIVFVGADDPVQAGLVASLNRPGGNLTGITFMGASLGAKRLELARELVPNAGLIAVLSHPNSPDSLENNRDLQTAAASLDQDLMMVHATNDAEIDAAFETIAQRKAAVLIVSSDPFIFERSGLIAALAVRNRIPAIYLNSESVAAGGLMSYGASVSDAWRLAGVYAGRILKGDKPAELPIIRPTRFDLVINLNAAKALGITIPPSLLARADEVIE